MSRVLGALLALTLLPSTALAAAQGGWSCSSGEQQAALVELYTSQGCSSCPPADRWLSAAKQREDLWTAVVPVAWHVTYWDYIGWRDPFGDRSNDRRQREMARDARAQVYTPGMFLNRGEFRRWYRLPPGAAENAPRSVGTLAAMEEEGIVTVVFTPAPGVALRKPRLELVYLRSGQHTAVKAGENHGRELTNDFVAGKIHRAELSKDGQSWQATLSAAPTADSNAVALWITERDGTLVQATGGWL